MNKKIARTCRYSLRFLLFLGAGACSQGTTLKPVDNVVSPGNLLAVRRECGENVVPPPKNPDACARYHYSDGVQRVCLVDCGGNTFSLFDNDLLSVPEGQSYGVYFQFSDSAFQQMDLTDANAIRAYAAPWKADSLPCCPEDVEGNRIPAAFKTDERHGILIDFVGPVQEPGQIAVYLDYSLLFPGGGSGCSVGDHPCSGWTIRFYVDGEE